MVQHSEQRQLGHQLYVLLSGRFDDGGLLGNPMLHLQVLPGKGEVLRVRHILGSEHSQQLGSRSASSAEGPQWPATSGRLFPCTIQLHLSRGDDLGGVDGEQLGQDAEVGKAVR